MSETNNNTIDESLVAQLVEKQLSEKTQGLLDNKNKILGEKKELQEKYNALEKEMQTFSQVDISLYNEMLTQKKMGELTGQGASKELAELQLQYEQRQKDLESSQKLLEAESAKYSTLQNDYHGLLKKQAVLNEMAEHKFNPATNEILLSHLLGSADVRADGESIAVVMTQDGIQKTPKEFMSDFVKTDAAKSFLLSNVNSGGGASGGGGASEGFKGMTATQLNDFARANPDRTQDVVKEIERRNKNG